MRRAACRAMAVSATAALLLLLSGCFKLDMDLTVNSDDTVDGVMIVAVDKDLAAMAEEDSQVDEGELPPGSTVEDYDQDGFVGQKIALDNISMDQLDQSFSSEGDTGGPGEWSLTHEGDQYRFTGDMDLTDLAATGDEDFDMSAFLQGAELRVALTFPGDVTESNGDVDGNTVVWEPKIGEKNDMTAVAEEGAGLSTLVILGIAVAAVLVLFIAAGVVLLVRGRRPSDPQSGVPAAPAGVS